MGYRAWKGPAGTLAKLVGYLGGTTRVTRTHSFIEGNAAAAWAPTLYDPVLDRYVDLTGGVNHMSPGTAEPLLLEHTGTDYVYLPGTTGNNVSVPNPAGDTFTTWWRVMFADSSELDGSGDGATFAFGNDTVGLSDVKVASITLYDNVARDDDTDVVGRFSAAASAEPHAGYTDSHANVWTVNRAASGRKTAVVDRALWLHGAQEWLEAGSNAAFQFGTGAYSVVVVARQSVPTNVSVFISGRGTGSSNGWRYYFHSLNRYSVAGATGANSPTDSRGTARHNLATAIWFSRDGDGLHSFYENDNLHGTDAGTSADVDITAPLYLGRSYTGTGASMEVIGAAVFPFALTPAQAMEVRDEFLTKTTWSATPALPLNTYYVATTGNNTNDGSLEFPFRDLQHAAQQTQPGDTIYLRGGSYETVGTDIFYHTGLSGIGVVEVNGVEGHPITISSYPGEWAVFDGENHSLHPRSLDDYASSVPDLLRVIGNWVIIENLEFRNGAAKGLSVYGDRNIIRKIRSHHHNNDAFYHSGSYNLFEDLIGHDCYSINNGGNSADAIKVVGSGSRFNVYRRCGAYNVSDDGFDVIGSYDNTFEDCYAFNVGFGTTGNANGFKLGGAVGEEQRNVFRRCIAGWNAEQGFSGNGAFGVTLLNCTAWGNNRSANLNTSYYDDSGDLTIARNNVAYDDLNGMAPASAVYLLRENNTEDLAITDPLWVSTDPTNAGFLALSETSPARDAGHDDSDLGAVAFGAQFPATYWPILVDPLTRGGWDPEVPYTGAAMPPPE